MKLFVYAMRDFDELGIFRKLCDDAGVELGWSNEYCRLGNADLAAGYDYISVTPSTLDRPLLTKFHELGVSGVATRSIGFDHIDLDALRDLGMHATHTVYEPETVANYAIMLSMMMLRRMTKIAARASVQDYTLRDKLGRDISGCTVGVVGTGSIGGTVVRHLQGFGCKVLAYDPYPRADIAQLATYVDLDELLAQSDVVTLHAPACAENHHMLDERAFRQMKPGAILVNTARGTLVDTDALIAALESGKLGGAALDVLEKEDGLYYNDRVGDVIANHQMAILRAMPNVLLTPHTAFYTDIVVYQMALTVVEGALAMSGDEQAKAIADAKRLWVA